MPVLNTVLTEAKSLFLEAGGKPEDFKPGLQEKAILAATLAAVNVELETLRNKIRRR